MAEGLIGDFAWLLTPGRALSAAALLGLDKPFCFEPEAFFSERKLSLSESTIRTKDNIHCDIAITANFLLVIMKYLSVIFNVKFFSANKGDAVFRKTKDLLDCIYFLFSLVV